MIPTQTLILHPHAKCDFGAELRRIQPKGFKTDFKIDTGAGVAILAEQFGWIKAAGIQPSGIKLQSPGSEDLQIKDQVTTALHYKGEQVTETL